MAQNLTPPMSTSSVPPLVPASVPSTMPASAGSASTLPASVPSSIPQQTIPVPPSLPQPGQLDATRLPAALPPPSMLPAGTPVLPPPTMPQSLSATSLVSGPQLPPPVGPQGAPPVGPQVPPPVAAPGIPLEQITFQKSQTGTVFLPQASGTPVALQPPTIGPPVAMGPPAPETPTAEQPATGTPVPLAPPAPQDRGVLVTSTDPLLDTANMPGKGEFYGATGRALDDETSAQLYPVQEDWAEKVEENPGKIIDTSGRKTYRYGWYGATKDKYNRYCGIWALFILMPWLMFTTIVTILVFAYHHFGMPVWCCVCMFLGIACLFAVLGITNRRNGQKFAILGALCAFATFVGCMAGLWEYHKVSAQYWLTDENRVYTNVLPGEPAVGHSDAGTLIFSVDSRVDLGKVVGYKSSGTVYCVAPITRQADTLDARIEYFAAGTDCCHARTGFTCGNAWNKNARSGLMLPESQPSKSLLFPGHREQYLRAAREAASIYGMVLSDEPLFLTWATDILQAHEDMLHDMLVFVFASSGLYLLFACVCGAIAHFVTRYQIRAASRKQSAEDLFQAKTN